jgi:hypothetical protein
MSMPLIEAGPASYRGGYEGGPYKRFNSCRFESLLVLLELPGGGPIAWRWSRSLRITRHRSAILRWWISPRRHALCVVTIVLLLDIIRRILGIGSADAGAVDRT